MRVCFSSSFFPSEIGNYWHATRSMALCGRKSLTIKLLPRFLRIGNDSKVKKTPPSYAKKTGGPPPNHHSGSLYPTSDSYYDQRTSSNFDLSSRHSDRAPLETNYKKKRDKDKEKDKERLARGENEFPHLPDVPGAEGKQLVIICYLISLFAKPSPSVLVVFRFGTNILLNGFITSRVLLFESS